MNTPETSEQPAPAVASSAWLADLVDRWREAENHWRKRAIAIDRDHKGKPIYEDGLAEAFGRCADILANEMSANADISDGEKPMTPKPK